eukprot:CAMPEP_0116006376 /NCGR_PEP_ID=MMETSP0321-20121206/1695_1 /TAXON_ID=163516 /ORGANISM="Leptocylindrus danicus var. danicus, Strain B650" /LENGTH=935 /DNA_ID=CAMNT_0003474925 /DNA_START=114 /DNA_END=2922 /DNA_ORIENTATION=+
MAVMILGLAAAWFLLLMRVVSVADGGIIISPGISENGTHLESTTCYDDAGWVNNLGHGCDWFNSDYTALSYTLLSLGFGVDGCVDMSLNGEKYDENGYLIVNPVFVNFGTTECCVCGGGTRVNSSDTTTLPPSYSSIVPEPPAQSPPPMDMKNAQILRLGVFTGYGCPWYGKPLEQHFPDIAWSGTKDPNATTCSKFGGLSLDNGYVPNSACCVCHGGVNLTRVIHEEKENTKEKNCISFPGFSDETGTFVCSDYTSIYENPFALYSCERYGNAVGKYGLTVNKACCECGGGYRGLLLGRQFRVAYTEDWSDSLYTLFPAQDDAWKKNGSIPALLNLAANAAGFGMYEDDIDPYSIEAHPGSTYSQCLTDVFTGSMDFCIGHIWNATSGNALATKSLFQDRFYLVVPIEKVTWLDSFLTPFLPFQAETWLWIIGIALYMVIVLNFIQTGGPFKERKSLCSRVGAVFYTAANSFSSGGVSDVSENPSSAEKVIVAAFAVSMLIILTAYTATSAAALVVRDTTKFKNLEDVIQYPSAKLCIKDILYDSFLTEHPESQSVLKSRSNKTMEILNMMKCDGDDCCDAAIVHEDAYRVATAFDLVYCTSMKMLLDEVLMKVDNVIYISASLGEYAKDFIQEVNVLIEAGSYNELHRYFKSLVDNKEISPPDYPDLRWHGNKCPSETDEPDGEELNLGPFQLLFPLCLSMAATTLGLLFHLGRKKVRVLVQAKVGKELSEDNEDFALRRTIEAMPASKIVKELKSFGTTDHDKLSAAVDSLPDKSALVDLMFQSCCSVYSINRDIVYNALAISELCDLMEYCDSSLGLKSARITDKMLDDDNIKEKLVRGLMTHPRSRRLALTCARQKEEVGAEEFSVLVFLGIQKVTDEEMSESSTLLQKAGSEYAESKSYSIASINRRMMDARIQSRALQTEERIRDNFE